MTDQVHSDIPYSPALVIFGLDDSGKAHASSFSEGDVALATKAAALMGMRLLPVQSEDERALAAKVPKGKVFASGKGFVPFVKAGLFAEIAAIAPHVDASTSLDHQSSGEPSELVEETNDQAMSQAAALLTANPAPVPQPTGWHDIQAGSIVLSSPFPGEMDWFECTVVKVEPDDRYELRYCDWPSEPTFTHHIIDIGLLHPTRQPEPTIDVEPAAAA